MKQKGLISKSDVVCLVKNVATLATNAELKAEEDKLIKIQTFDLSYFRGKNHFEDDYTQNYFSQCTNILKRLVILIIFKHGNLKDCLMKVLSLFLHLIIVLVLH